MEFVRSCFLLPAILATIIAGLWAIVNTLAPWHVSSTFWLAAALIINVAVNGTMLLFVYRRSHYWAYNSVRGHIARTAAVVGVRLPTGREAA
jgi:hypothetical protein